MTATGRLDVQLPAQAMDHDVPWGTMFGKASTGLEGEQQEPERTAMDQAGLAVPGLCRVGFRLKRAGEVRQVEG